MHRPAITGTGVFTPELVITNAELVEAFNAYADKWNAENADAIAKGEALTMNSSEECSLASTSPLAMASAFSAFHLSA